MDIKKVKRLLEKFHRTFDETKWCQDYWSMVVQTDEAWKIWEKLKPEIEKLIENAKAN